MSEKSFEISQLSEVPVDDSNTGEVASGNTQMSKKHSDITSVTIPEHLDNSRLDVALLKCGAYASRSLAEKYCDKSLVTVNGKLVQKRYKVKTGDVVEYKPHIVSKEPVGQDIPLDVRYEDDDIIVISKQAGLICHPAPGHDKDTLVNALISYCGQENLCDIQGDKSRLGIVHRLDGDTSGLMIVAKTNKAALILTKNLQDHTINRHYKALVYGIMKHNTGKIDAPIMRVICQNNRPKMLVKDDYKAKDAVTTFKTLQRFDTSASKDIDCAGFSLLDCKLFTGRTHQIRSHMEWIGFPVVGDRLYDMGAPKDFDRSDIKKMLNLKRHFLHSYKLQFKHPVSGKNMEFSDDLPQDLQNVLNSLEDFKCEI